MVIQSYYEPPAPSWEEYGRFEFEGWTGVASLPTHRKMSQEWKITLLDENGEEVEIEVPAEQLTHNPIFGPDVDDVAQTEQLVKELITIAKAARQQNQTTLYRYFFGNYLEIKQLGSNGVQRDNNYIVIRADIAERTQFEKPLLAAAFNQYLDC